MEQTKKIAVLTSGGDAPGMNACLRSVVRTALNKGWQVYGIRDAYRGLVEGGKMISPLDWVDVGWNFREGGTFLGSARFTALMGDGQPARALKKKALQNLKKLGISGLIVIGGDGSLTGAYELFKFLKQSDPPIKGFQDPNLSDLSIVGIPGSIDNDIALTEMSIGADTTLNTIVECIDRLRDTAASHRRINIVEVMGHLRGYLAVMSGLATGADRVFIREEKITQNELNDMLVALKESFAHGQKAGIVIRSEGASFSTAFLKETISGLLEPKREVRETVLGHLQRGGNPTAFERILATRMGVKAIQLLEQGPAEPQMAGLIKSEIESFPLTDSIKRMQTPEFQKELSANTQNAFHLSKVLELPPFSQSSEQRIGVLTDGSNVSGMNIAIRAIARLAINKGMRVIGIKGGFSGLAQGLGNAFALEWNMLEMKGILRRAGTLLSVSGDAIEPEKRDYSTLGKHLAALKIDGLVVIGDRMTYECGFRLAQKHRLPTVGIPAALSCNQPGTDWVIGMDSALNDLIKGIDRAADAAHVLKKVFLIHVKGEYCKCLVQSAALAGGAEIAIIKDDGQAKDGERFKKAVLTGITVLKRIISQGKSFATIIFFSQEPHGADEALAFIRQCILDSRTGLETSFITLETTLGGIIPTAFDRILAQRLGEKAMTTLEEGILNRDPTFHIVGMQKRAIGATRFHDLKDSLNKSCSASFTAEIDQCITLMSQPGGECVGMGGDIAWTDLRDEMKWQGLWTCKKCGHARRVSFSPEKTLCVFCRHPACHNYGYIRMSRHL